ncbi:hypothetical protein M1N64_03565 [Peptococcaceae bacterium]|nr:hypothetical protein [Peptococcaceae bacterium]
MRQDLKKINGTRDKFTGTFVRKGIKTGFKGQLETILLSDIRDVDNNLVADHLWFNFTKGFADANLTSSKKVEFYARVKKYTKGYQGYREDVNAPISVDYKLSHPTKIKVIFSK